MYDQNEAENECDEMRNSGWWQLQFGQISVIEKLKNAKLWLVTFFLLVTDLLTSSQFTAPSALCTTRQPS